jgi:hypothetical protein
MPALSETLSVAARSFIPLVSTCHSYVNLLQAHEHASAHLQPLLTEAGICYIHQQLLLSQDSQLLLSQDSENKSGQTEFACGESNTDRSIPYWDALGRRLWLGGILLKEFQQPSPNQTRLLDVFQEEGWVLAHIDDPLPLAPWEKEKDAKRRLHDTIKNLNRGLPRGTIRFRGDGTGQGVRWQYDQPRLVD